jgi:hypothetical protein
MSLELSPGFFDPRVALSDDEDDIIPKNINIEKINANDVTPPRENVFVSFVKFVIMNVQKKDCGCNDGWKRTHTY